MSYMLYIKKKRKGIKTMEENKKEVIEEEIVEEVEEPAKKPAKKKKLVRRVVDEEPEKEGFFHRVFVKHKEAWLGGLAGLGIGIGGSIGLGELGKRRCARRQNNPTVMVNTNPLDPNL